MNASGPGGRAQGRWGVGEGCRRILLSDVAFLVRIPAGRKESVGGGGFFRTSPVQFILTGWGGRSKGYKRLSTLVK